MLDLEAKRFAWTVDGVGYLEDHVKATPAQVVAYIAEQWSTWGQWDATEKQAWADDVDARKLRLENA